MDPVKDGGDGQPLNVYVEAAPARFYVDDVSVIVHTFFVCLIVLSLICGVATILGMRRRKP